LTENPESEFKSGKYSNCTAQLDHEYMAE
jgi:hypothetical protein